MPIFRPPGPVAWRPAPLWQSLLEGVLLAPMPMLLVGPSMLGLGGTMRPASWLGFAVLLGLYGWLFNRLRPANPPAEALVPWRVAVYGGVVVLSLGAVLATCVLVGDAAWILGSLAVAFVAVVGVGQWFERGLERQVTERGLDRSPGRQSRRMVADTRRVARGEQPGSRPMPEPVTQRWARERQAGYVERGAPPQGMGAEVPEKAAEAPVRHVYRPTDRERSDNPNKRRKKRR